MKLNSLIRKWRNSELPLYDYLEQLPDHTFSYTDDLLIEIQEAIRHKASEYLEMLLCICSWDGVNNRYTKLLCNLLNADWHEWHEDIVMLLDEIKDPESIDSIYEIALKIPDFDDGRSLAKKSIWALGSIGTIKAMGKLKILSENEDPIINKAARLELTRFS